MNILKPDRICTSYVERNNWTIRCQVRRFTRLTNAFSKKLENLRAAVALWFAYYNLCRVHGSIRVTARHGTPFARVRVVGPTTPVATLGSVAPITKIPPKITFLDISGGLQKPDPPESITERCVAGLFLLVRPCMQEIASQPIQIVSEKILKKIDIFTQLYGSYAREGGP